MSAEKPSVDFESPEEFEELCRYIAMRMHSLNRTMMGESVFAAETAKMLDRLGRSFAEGYRDEAVQDAFGAAYSSGTLAREDRAAALFARLGMDR